VLFRLTQRRSQFREFSFPRELCSCSCASLRLGRKQFVADFFSAASLWSRSSGNTGWAGSPLARIPADRHGTDRDHKAGRKCGLRKELAMIRRKQKAVRKPEGARPARERVAV